MEEEAGWEADPKGGQEGRTPRVLGTKGHSDPSYLWSICGGEGISVAVPLLIRGGRGFLLRLRETRTKH